MNMSKPEQQQSEMPIGSYGMQWMHFMETEHPELVEEMQAQNQYLAVARSVDKSAWAYRDLLDKQYEQANPRPTDFHQTLAWERARDFYTASTIMRERVLVPVTRP